MAEELLQEALLRAYRAAATFEPRAAVSTWLFRIAANLCSNEAQSARSRHEIVAEPPELAAAQADPAKVLEQKELSAAVEAALATLPPQQRAAVQLARFEGLSYAEVAEVLGVSGARWTASSSARAVHYACNCGILREPTESAAGFPPRPGSRLVRGRRCAAKRLDD